MSVFAPIPLVLSSILCGRKAGLTLALICTTIVYVLSFQVFFAPTFFAAYFFFGLFALILAEIFHQKLPPVSGFFKAGLALLILFSLMLLFIVGQAEGSLVDLVAREVGFISEQFLAKKSELLAQGGEEAWSLFQMASDPQRLAKEILKIFPAALFSLVFFVLWLNLYTLLRIKNVLGYSYPYSLKSFTKLKLPDWCVWVFIPVLFLAIFGPKIFPETVWLEIGAMNLLRIFGLLYFFQGIGIYLDFLDAMSIKSLFLRIFLILLTFLTASWLISLLGLFDIWVNFRKFFKKK